MRILLCFAALLFAPPAQAQINEIGWDIGVLGSGGTPFLSRGGGTLTFGAVTYDETAILDGRLNLIPAWGVDWVVGQISGKGGFPITEAMSGEDYQNAWYPLAEVTAYSGRDGLVPVFGAAFNSIPKNPGDQDDDRVAIPLYMGAAWVFEGDGDSLFIIPSVSGGWSITKNTRWYADARLLARVKLAPKFALFLRSEFMYQHQRDVPDITGTGLEGGVTFYTGGN
jgi:hypothetical protein